MAHDVVVIGAGLAGLTAARDLTRNGFDAVVLAGSLAAVLALFAAPVILLGCVSPYAIRLSLPDVASSGRTSPRRAGSIAR